MKIAFRQFVCIATLLLLSGCGFHLRGHEPLPPQLQTLYLQSDAPYGSLTKQLEQTLRSAGVVVTTEPQSAPYTLQIQNENLGQLITGQGVSGQLATYLLTYSVSYQLLDAKGRAIQPQQSIVATRSYSISANQVLGDTSVKNNLEEDMRRDLITQLLNRLRAKKMRQALSHQ